MLLLPSNLLEGPPHYCQPCTHNKHADVKEQIANKETYHDVPSCFSGDEVRLSLHSKNHIIIVSCIKHLYCLLNKNSLAVKKVQGQSEDDSTKRWPSDKANHSCENSL